MNFPAEGKWLLAVSTGPDSMALLHMAMTRQMHIGVAHVNYHHREQADQEEAYIRSFCAKQKLPLYVENRPFTWVGNFEASARKWRYAFFKQVVEEYGYDGVLVGHNEDDNLETYIMQKEKNLIPQTYGIAPSTMIEGVLVLRPLLDKTKAELQQYCDDNGVRYFIDVTNEDRNYTRNRIRNDIVAKLTRAERDALRQEMETMRQERIIIHDRAVKNIHNNRVQLEEYRLLEESVRLTILRILYDCMRPISYKQLCAVDKILRKENDFYIPFGDNILVQENGQFFPYQEKEAYAYTYVSVEELLKHPFNNHYIVEEGSLGVYGVTLSSDDFPVTIRSVQDGDAIAMRFGKKKVHRFFIDRHIPLYQRKSWPVVLNVTEDIILVPGLGCDCNHYSIKPSVSVIQYFNSEGEK